MKERILSTIGSKQTMWMPMILFAASFVFYLWLVWERVPGILGDQGWFLQVSRRVAAGEILYRDVLWSYGPLPVYLMSWLMQHGNQDIIYFSLLHIFTATFATVGLYGLHRYQLKPVTAAISAGIVLLVGGTAGPFLFSYTPGIPIGAFGMVLTLLGVLGCLKPRHRFLGVIGTALGLGIALLCKLEFGVGALALCVFASIIVFRTRLDSAEDALHIKGIIAASATGIFLAVIVYGAIAIQSDWQPLLDGITGYQVLQVAAGVSIGYWSGWSKSWLLSVYIPAGAIVMMTGAYVYRNNLPKLLKRAVWLISIILLLGYLAYILVWQSGIFLDVQRAPGFGLDATLIGKRLQTAWTALVWFAPLQFQKSYLIGIGIIALILAPRWIKRLHKREVVSFEQLVCLMTIAFAVLIEMRYLIFATSFLLSTVLVLLTATLPAEFPQLKASLRKIDRTIVVAGVIAGLLAINTLYNLWQHFGNFDTPQTSPHGTFLADSETQSAAFAIVQYVTNNTNATDCIAVAGPFPGIYYLSERRNCFRADYLSPVVGSGPSDAIDYLERMEQFAPPVLLVPQGDHNAGILQLRGTPDDGVFVRATHRRLFGDAAPQVEAYLREHYQFDRFLNENHVIEFAAFKRVK